MAADRKREKKRSRQCRGPAMINKVRSNGHKATSKNVDVETLYLTFLQNFYEAGNRQQAAKRKPGPSQKVSRDRIQTLRGRGEARGR